MMGKSIQVGKNLEQIAPAWSVTEEQMHQAQLTIVETGLRAGASRSEIADAVAALGRPDLLGKIA